jgi:hypothetical protein
LVEKTEAGQPLDILTKASHLIHLRTPPSSSSCLVSFDTPEWNWMQSINP